MDGESLDAHSRSTQKLKQTQIKQIIRTNYRKGYQGKYYLTVVLSNDSLILIVVCCYFPFLFVSLLLVGSLSVSLNFSSRGATTGAWPAGGKNGFFWLCKVSLSVSSSLDPQCQQGWLSRPIGRAKLTSFTFLMRSFVVGGS